MKENGLLFAPSFLMRVKSRFINYMEEYMTIELETKISISREV
jgi:hypothetical protein